MATSRRESTPLIQRTRETVLVGSIDLVLLLGMLLVGVYIHGANPITAPVETTETVLPFVIAGVPIAILAGLYHSETLHSPRRAVRLTAIGWLAIANVGLILRSAPLFDGGTGWPFNLVLTGIGLIVFLPWRFVYAYAVIE